MEWFFIDRSYAKAHPHSSGTASGNDEAIGTSRAGNTGQIHLVVASRFDNLKRNYESVVAMACAFLLAIHVKRQQALEEVSAEY